MLKPRKCHQLCKQFKLICSLAKPQYQHTFFFNKIHLRQTTFSLHPLYYIHTKHTMYNNPGMPLHSFGVARKSNVFVALCAQRINIILAPAGEHFFHQFARTHTYTYLFTFNRAQVAPRGKTCAPYDKYTSMRIQIFIHIYIYGGFLTKSAKKCLIPHILFIFKYNILYIK